ncbi:MAG: hypothetical protein ACRBI6_11230 [Acidimicrobiales bacterium]
MRARLFSLVAATVLVTAACGSSSEGDGAERAPAQSSTTITSVAGDTTTSSEPTTGSSPDEGDGRGDDHDGEASEPGEETPSVVWMIDGDTFDAVAIDVASGDEIARVPGWGAEFGAGSEDESEGPLQALQTIDVVHDGAAVSVWLDDCCEPAFGSSFGVDPTATAGTDSILEAATVTVMGLGPAISTDGELVAVGVGDLGVTVAETATGITVVDLGSVLADAVGDPEAYIFWRSLAWADDRLLAVAAPIDEGSTVSFVDVADPTAPVVGASIGLEGTVLDATSGEAGTVVLLVESGDGVEGVVVEAVSGEVVDRFPTLAGAVHLDGSPDGTRFLVVDDAGDVVVQTADGGLETVDLGGRPAIDAAWG